MLFVIHLEKYVRLLEMECLKSSVSFEKNLEYVVYCLHYHMLPSRIHSRKHLTQIFTFFYIYKKEVLGSRKFSTSGVRWIYIFWDVLNKIWPILENVCLLVCLSVLFCGRCISRTNGRKLFKLDIQLHLYRT